MRSIKRQESKSNEPKFDITKLVLLMDILLIKTTSIVGKQ